MKKKILIVAYTCSPAGLSEQWLGWKWVEMAAKDSTVHLITRPGREGLREACENSGIHLHEVPVPRAARHLTQKFGDLGVWLRVHAWAQGVRRKVEDLSKEEFSYAHLVTFHSVQMPYVFEGFQGTKVWGPVSGMEFVPRSYFGWIKGERFKETIRNWVLSLCKPGMFRRASHYDLMLYGNTQTRDLIEKYRNGIHRIVLPNHASRPDGKLQPRNWDRRTQLRLAFVGSCQGRRGLPLLIEALRQTKGLDWRLDVAGTGSGLYEWKRYVAETGMDERVFFHGWVGKEVVMDLYEGCHLFAFPSLRDGGGSGMLEALERGIPVLALDWGGPADVIDASKAGVMFTVNGPEKTICEMKAWFGSLINDEDCYRRLAKAACDFEVKRFSWDEKNALLDSGLTEITSGATKD